MSDTLTPEQRADLDARWETIREELLAHAGMTENAMVATVLNGFYRMTVGNYAESLAIHRDGAAVEYGGFDAHLQNIGMRLNAIYTGRQAQLLEAAGERAADVTGMLGRAIRGISVAFQEVTDHRPIFPRTGPMTSPGMPLDPRYGAAAGRGGR